MCRGALGVGDNPKADEWKRNDKRRRSSSSQLEARLSVSSFTCTKCLSVYSLELFFLIILSGAPNTSWGRYHYHGHISDSVMREDQR